MVRSLRRLAGSGWQGWGLTGCGARTSAVHQRGPSRLLSLTLWRWQCSRRHQQLRGRVPRSVRTYGGAAAAAGIPPTHDDAADKAAWHQIPDPACRHVQHIDAAARSSRLQRGWTGGCRWGLRNSRNSSQPPEGVEGDADRQVRPARPPPPERKPHRRHFFYEARPWCTLPSGSLHSALIYVRLPDCDMQFSLFPLYSS